MVSLQAHSQMAPTAQRSFRHDPVQPISEAPRPALGQVLLQEGRITSEALRRALDAQRRQNAPLGEILIAQDAITERDLLHSLALSYGTKVVDFNKYPPDSRLFGMVRNTDCLAFDFIPWRMLGETLIVALARPGRIDEVRRKLPPDQADAHFVLAPRSELHGQIERHLGAGLAELAECRTDAALSCRGWSVPWILMWSCLLVAGLVTWAILAPQSLLLGCFLTAVAALTVNTMLKLTCAIIALSRRNRPPDSVPPPDQITLPKISVLVPLFRERDVAGALVQRLARISYPRELLEIVLVCESGDEVTREAVMSGGLPPWMRVIQVPPGTVQTKPRALNYALDFTTGTIVGVYDAEDAPDPDQLIKVAQKFASGGSRLACVQGQLSYYNQATNWMSRCFFFEYAGWFRVMLPGLQALGFAIPLGGTTLFFRRDALLKLGAWDAHNVTEDADLGIRLARRGYRCEILHTVTHEEANSRIWPWIKQRSRWLKGYTVTWLVHMRRPWQLWRDLGPWQFLGFQILFLATLTAFFTAPFLWWAAASIALGIPHPSLGLLPDQAWLALTGFFILAEVTTLSVFVIATRKLDPRPHVLWAVTLPFYFAFGTIAAYKGLIEILFRPFHWEKTEHGMFGGKHLGEPMGTLIGRNLTSVDLEPRLESDREVVTQRP